MTKVEGEIMEICDEVIKRDPKFGLAYTTKGKELKLTALKIVRFIEDKIYIEYGKWLHNHGSRILFWHKYRIATTFEYPILEVYSLKERNSRNLLIRFINKLRGDKAHLDKILLAYNMYNGMIRSFHSGNWAQKILKDFDSVKELAKSKKEEINSVEAEELLQERQSRFAPIDY